MCQEARCSICELADQLLFASVSQRRHAAGKQSLYQKLLLCFTVQELHFRPDAKRNRLRYSKQTFSLRILTHKSCCLHRPWDALVRPNKYGSSYFAERKEC